MSKRNVKKVEPRPALSDDWRTFNERRLQTGDDSFRTLISLCGVWEIRAAAEPQWLFVGCAVSYNKKHDLIAEVPNGPTLLLSGDEPMRPNIGAHERRVKDERLAEIERLMSDFRESASKFQKRIDELEAERRDLIR